MAFSGMINLKSGQLTLGGQFEAYKRGQLERNIQYVTREIFFNRRNWGIVPSYELLMPCPRGISGAPLIRMQSNEIIGVIYGTNDVALIEELASIDPDTGNKTPEIQRVVSFGLAHLGTELYNLVTPHTDNTPLGDFLKNKGSQTT